MFRSALIIVLLVAAVCSCGPAAGKPDSGADVPDAATIDAGFDAGISHFDAGIDAGTDAGIDAGYQCGPSNCLGCCSGNVCTLPFDQSANACGSGGLSCSKCLTTESCSGGICAGPTNGPCDFTNCDGCCLSSTKCVRFGAQSVSTCGNNGSSCGSCGSGAYCFSGACQGGTNCNATTCKGCCDGNSCVPLADENATSCGASASTCISCRAGESCEAGQCVNSNASACLFISPNEYDFRNVQLSCSSPTVTFKIWNQCASPVTVNAVSLTGANASNFVLSPGSLPISVAANYGSTTVQVRYVPTSAMVDEATLAVDSTESSQSSRYQIPLFGSGATTGANVDEFTAPRKVDALYVIDDSGGMEWAQDNVRDNAFRFFAYPFAAGIDFQFAATTTSDRYTYPRGAFLSNVSHPAILTNSTPYLLSKFRNKVTPGGNGDPAATGLNPSREAVTPPLSTGTNAGFLRNDAALGIAVLTESGDFSPVPGAFNLAVLQTVKGSRHPNDFSFSSIGAFGIVYNPNCAGYSSGLDNGTYAAAISATGGAKQDLCTTNWSDSVADMGRALFGLRYTWFLLATPDLSGSNTLTVSVNGNALTTGWSYDAATNSVTFDPAFAPRAGQTVSFTYSRACLP